MKIAVIGGGSIGLLFAAYLQSRFNVSLYTRSIEQAEKINETGITVLRDNETFTARVTGRPLAASVDACELAIVAVKQYQLATVLPTLSGIPNVLFLQNGMGHLKLIEKLANRNIFVGSVEHGALRNGPAHVTHNGTGVTRAAVFRGSGSILYEFSLNPIHHFSFAIEADYYAMLARKLAANAVINPLTAILRVPNGELITNHHYKAAFENLFSEVAETLDFQDQDVQLQKVKDICRNTSGNRSSMLKDIEAGRITEVDAILGYLLERAEEKGKNVPLIHAFYKMVKGLEKEMGGKP